MKIVELLIDEIDDLLGFDTVALVKNPAIEAGFFAFKDQVEDAITLAMIEQGMKEKLVERLPGEGRDEYISRCIPVLRKEGFPEDQAAAICYAGLSMDRHHKILYVSVIKTDEGNKYAIDNMLQPELQLETGLTYCLDQCDKSNQKHPLRLSTTPDGVHNGGEVYLGTGVDEVEYSLDKVHFTPNQDTPKELFYFCVNHPGMGGKIIIDEQMNVDVSSLPDYTHQIEKKDRFYTDIPPGDLPLKRDGKTELRSYTDYPQAATNNAKRALKWAEKEGWGSCGTAVGKQRANQLAKREPISEDTIARMASFERHRRNKNTPYGEGCGKLMWDAWGGDEGIAWAQRKLEQIKREKEMSLKKDLFFEDIPSQDQDKILETLSMKGITYSDVTKRYDILEPEEFFKRCFVSATTGLPIKSDATGENAQIVKGSKVLYRYEGPVDSKTRTFCRRMMSLSQKGMLFSEQDLTNIVGSNPDFPPYNIFMYKGSHGCRHNWNKVFLYEKQPEQIKETKQKITVEFFNNQNKKYKFNIDEEKRRVTGPLLIPDKLIVRFDENNEPYYVYFSQETVEKIANKMMVDGLLDKVNLEHDQDSPVNGQMLESWIIQDSKNDKSNAFGMELPNGTWMGTYQIEDDSIWNMIKSGDLTGFSIEGFFADKLIQH